MKCPRCLAVCLDTDPFCFSCRTPFAGRGNAQPGAENGKPAYAARLSMIFMAVGACFGPVVGQNVGLVEKSAGGIDLNQAVWAGIGASVGGTLGALLGALAFGTRSRK